MIEKYFLNEELRPTIPVPHDCVITDVSIENQCIVFKFEDDLCKYDSVKNIRPNAKSLIIKIHMMHDNEDFSLYRWHKPIKFLAKNGYYKKEDNSEINRLDDNGLEYLYHYVAYCSIIIKLYSDEEIILDVEADYVEYEWIDY